MVKFVEKRRSWSVNRKVELCNRLGIAAIAISLGLAACGSEESTQKPASALDAAQTQGDSAADSGVDAAADATSSALLLKPSVGPDNFAVAAAGWYRGDLHFHTNHSEDALAQGGDDMKGALAVADAFRHPDFLKYRPELAGNGLDYIAVTDHRTDKVLQDPDFQHPHLILLPGEEFGSMGHAGIWGFKKHIPHEPQKGESANQRLQDAVDEAHAMGALFSINHPTQDNVWAWDLKDVDGIEIWNGPWSAFYGPSDEKGVDERVAGAGVENPYIRQAVVTGGGGGSNHQALKFWQYHLSAGRHLAPVGGGDRHMLMPAGLPTTYVHAPDDATQTGKALGPQGILKGIAQKRTFVARSPFAAQVDLEAVDKAGKTFPMGSQLVAGQTFIIRITVSRAKDGLVRLYSAPLGETLAGKWPEPQVVLEAPIAAERVQGEWSWTVPAGGAWLHAVVLDPAGVEKIPPEFSKLNEVFSKIPEGKSITDMIKVLSTVVDASVLMYPEDCDPAKWHPWMGQCMTADKTAMSTYYMPENLAKLMSRWFEDGKPTPWSLSAVSSAFLAKP